MQLSLSWGGLSDGCFVCQAARGRTGARGWINLLREASWSKGWLAGRRTARQADKGDDSADAVSVIVDHQVHSAKPPRFVLVCLLFGIRAGSFGFKFHYVWVDLGTSESHHLWSQQVGHAMRLDNIALAEMGLQARRGVRARQELLACQRCLTQEHMAIEQQGDVNCVLVGSTSNYIAKKRGGNGLVSTCKGDKTAEEDRGKSDNTAKVRSRGRMGGCKSDNGDKTAEGEMGKSDETANGKGKDKMGKGESHKGVWAGHRGTRRGYALLATAEWKQVQ